MSQFEPAINYLPHDTPMVLVDKVLTVSKEQAICQVGVTQEGILAPFLNEQNELPAWFAMEMMAQTIGVWRGWHDKQVASEAKLGLLLGVRGFKTSLAAYPSGAELQISVQLLLQDTQLASFDCQIMMSKKLITEAKLNVYQPNDEEVNLLIKKV